jgi:hypothetical protein
MTLECFAFWFFIIYIFVYKHKREGHLAKKLQLKVSNERD